MYMYIVCTCTYKCVFVHVDQSTNNCTVHLQLFIDTSDPQLSPTTTEDFFSSLTSEKNENNSRNSGLQLHYIVQCTCMYMYMYCMCTLCSQCFPQNTLYDVL